MKIKKIMNIQNFKNFINNLFILSPKKIWALVIIFLILLALAIILFPEIKKPELDTKFGKIKKPEITSVTENQYTTEKSSPTTYSVQLNTQQAKELVKTKIITVYEISPFRESELDKAKKLVQDLGFENQPEIDGQKYTWRNKLAMVRYDDTTKLFEYYGGLPSNQSTMMPSAEKFDKERCISIVKQRLNEYLLYPTNTELSVASTKFFWQTGMEIGETSDLSKANLFEISFTPIINGYPVLADYYSQELTTVQVNLGMSITRIIHHFAPLEIGASGTYPLLSLEKAGEKIKNNEGTIIDVQGSQLGYDVIDVKNVQLSNVKLAYLAKNDYLMPVYVFTGTGVLASGKRAGVTVFLAAIGEEWLE